LSHYDGITNPQGPSRLARTAIALESSIEPACYGQRMTLQERIRAIRSDTYALYLACRDPRVPWYAKALAGFILAYALSPVDLIPDFIPVLGYLDDLVIIPAGLLLARRLVPAHILEEHRRVAGHAPASKAGTIGVVALWLIALLVIGYVAWQFAF